MTIMLHICGQCRIFSDGKLAAPRGVLNPQRRFESLGTKLNPGLPDNPPDNDPEPRRLG